MFTVGEFSKICQVSVKTLHHYDRIGLLKPVKVDDFTGYRYYGEHQIEKMRLIKRLKRNGFPLEEIRELLNCTDGRTFFFRLLEQKKQLELQMKEISLIHSEISAHLGSMERTGDIMAYQKNYEVSVKEVPARAVLACRAKMGVEEFGKYYSALYDRVPKEKVTPDGITGAVYFDEEFNHECSDIELIVGVREKEKADKIMERTLCAVTIHKGSYSTLGDAYGALVTWIRENGYECAGAPYDIYVKTGFDSLPVEDWVTEVYFPVKKTGA